jgi:predicted small secreted protein
MNVNMLVKGIGLGMVAGVVVTAVMLPVDRKKLSRTGAGKTIKAIGNVVDNLADSFS